MNNTLSLKKRVLFITIVIVSGISLALGMAEMFLHFRAGQITNSNKLDSGMFQYDGYRGWKLSENWKGTHKHSDFQTIYSINEYGFRGDFNEIKKGCRNLYAVVGDSFTFGIGVQSGQTFVDLLNKNSRKECYLNFSIPGYSTDQEYLLIKDKVFPFLPKAVFLIVYLGNDIFDNAIAYPLQSSHAKPYFKIEPGGLKLYNSPVPHRIKPEEQVRRDLQFLSFNNFAGRSGFIAWMVRNSHLARVLGADRFMVENVADNLSAYKPFKKELELFNSIVKETYMLCNNRKVKLILVLLPGRSYIECPGSVPHQIQAYLGKNIVAFSETQSISIINLADSMQKSYRQTPGDWFFKNEGHLTPEGHRIVARLMQQWLAEHYINNRNRKIK